MTGEEPIAKSGCVHIDGTYKLLWKRSPVLVAAVSDCNDRTRLVAILVTTKEDGGAFTFLLKALKEIFEEMIGHKYWPSVVIVI